MPPELYSPNLSMSWSVCCAESSWIATKDSLLNWAAPNCGAATAIDSAGVLLMRHCGCADDGAHVVCSETS